MALCDSSLRHRACLPPSHPHLSSPDLPHQTTIRWQLPELHTSRDSEWEASKPRSALQFGADELFLWSFCCTLFQPSAGRKRQAASQAPCPAADSRAPGAARGSDSLRGPAAACSKARTLILMPPDRPRKLGLIQHRRRCLAQQLSLGALQCSDRRTTDPSTSATQAREAHTCHSSCQAQASRHSQQAQASRHRQPGAAGAQCGAHLPAQTSSTTPPQPSRCLDSLHLLILQESGQPGLTHQQQIKGS